MLACFWPGWRTAGHRPKVVCFEQPDPVAVSRRVHCVDRMFAFAVAELGFAAATARLATKAGDCRCPAAAFGAGPQLLAGSFATALAPIEGQPSAAGGLTLENQPGSRSEAFAS